MKIYLILTAVISALLILFPLTLISLSQKEGTKETTAVYTTTAAESNILF